MKFASNLQVTCKDGSMIRVPGIVLDTNMKEAPTMKDESGPSTEADLLEYQRIRDKTYIDDTEQVPTPEPPVSYLPSFKDIMLLLDAVVENSTELESEIKNKISILLGDVTEEPLSIEPQNGNFVVDSILYRLGVIDRHITSTMSQISRL